MAALALCAAVLPAGAAPVGAEPSPSAPAGPSGLAEAGQGDQELRPLDVVVAVDESGSLSEADVAEEIEATSTIVQSVLAEGSRVTVLGFGSDNGEPGQEAVTEVCPPTEVAAGPEPAQRLADCVRELHRRTPQEGDDTDHAAALGRALSQLRTGSPPGSARLVFLLTDGVLDVSDSPQYGRDPADRNDAAQRLIDDHLADARAAEVQVWPLGFGAADQDSLDAFAAGGYQEACASRPDAVPRAQVVDSGADVGRLLRTAFAAAICAGLTDEESASLAGGAQVDLQVEIPVIATDGSIVVTKNNPGIEVSYLDPEGRTVPSTGSQDGSEFSRSGENGPVEALRIRDPLPGTWTVRLSSPSGAAEELVSATALWQGAISTYLSVEGTGRPGEELTVRVELWTRRGVVSDPGALDRLDFGAQVSGPGLEDADIDLRDDGEPPDRTADDGQYAGTVIAPDRPATLDFTSVVQGEGVAADVRELPYEVTEAGRAVSARVEIERLDEVWPGRAINGTATVANDSAEPARIALLLRAGDELLATVEPAAAEVPPGRHSVPFTIALDPATPRGPATITVDAVSGGDPAASLGSSQPLNVEVRDAPGLLERYWWAWTALLLAATLAAGYASLLRARRREAADVRGLYAVLLRHGAPAGPDLRAPGKWSDRFRFVIRDEDGVAPRLEHPLPGETPYTAWRDRSGRIGVTTPRGERYLITPGGAGEALPGGLHLAFRDERRPAKRTPGRTRRRTEPAAPVAGGNPLGAAPADRARYGDGDPLL
ncbi:VWA domain-containing protein [Allonocardiopsis opalescens]|uniref:von Willebrand factor type A domain-containing protein n=1 Tax=Allonocardiopsis opalescens TaxID=1144618 RepID=A0A2T0Q478_9ACTN|nr:VWA domain-containing protein [Allonocardiopsis opalescens]PRX98563.1 von Willebrand factor type A domain-containing protein [Allonocardiopsis opalescens]